MWGLIKAFQVMEFLIAVQIFDGVGIHLLLQVLKLRSCETSRVMELKLSLIYPLVYKSAPDLIVAGHKLLLALLILMRNRLKRLAYCPSSVSFDLSPKT